MTIFKRIVKYLVKSCTFTIDAKTKEHSIVIKTRNPDNAFWILKFAKIEKNVIVFKGPNCVEIWSEEVWNEYFNDVNFEELADALDSLNNNG